MRKYNLPIAVLIGLISFAFMHGLVHLLDHFVLHGESHFLKQIILKTLIAVFSIVVGYYIFKMPLNNFSLRCNQKKVKQYKYILIAGFLGVLATLTMLVLKLPPMPVTQNLSPLQTIIVVWIFSTIGEEVFCRGFIQGLVKNEEQGFSIAGIQLSQAVLASALAFGLMHSTVYFMGGSPYTAITIICFTFLLGLVCGKMREENGLRSAIFTHLAFNVGGMLTAMVIKITMVMMHGLPQNH